jgi:hypothetical protein
MKTRHERPYARPLLRRLNALITRVPLKPGAVRALLNSVPSLSLIVVVLLFLSIISVSISGEIRTASPQRAQGALASFFLWPIVEIFSCGITGFEAWRVENLVQRGDRVVAFVTWVPVTILYSSIRPKA